MGEIHHIEVVHKLIDVLDTLGIPYAIGGSLASSAYGPMRFTQDADITVQPFPSLAEEFYHRVKDEFYVSEQAMRQALSTRGSFNVIHFETSFKIDLFVQGSSEFDQQLLARSRMVRLAEAGPRECRVVSPEDIILLKLRWFRETEGTSEHQWGDVLEVLAVQKHALDYGYLTRWAERIGLQELLNRALAEASI
ncbi:MAG: nucleotidyltransferase [Sedimentisphaerales bacterium]|nr:nucleotidyltransferase [Sedimentisphaerales bacterium]